MSQLFINSNDRLKKISRLYRWSKGEMEKMKRYAIVLLLLLCTILGIIFYIQSDKEQKEPIDMKQLVASYSSDLASEESASITSDQLIITDQNGKEESYPLPDDHFFVSIAPYIHTTHPCENHSLTGCQGELANETFEVFIEDEDGNVLVDQTMESQANGFIDLWLPRDQVYHVTIYYEDRQTSAEISTYESDNTCITTMQLM